VLGASADLYGSDKVLLDITDSLSGHCDLLVVLPAAGPLTAQLEDRGVRYLVLEDFAMRKRNMSPRGVLHWIARVLRTSRELGRLHRSRPFDLVYSNTLAVPTGTLFKLRFRIPHLWHVHEVLEGPKWFCWTLSLVVRIGSDGVICVSRSVMDQLTKWQPKLSRKCTVVYNGMPCPAEPANRPAGPAMILGSIGRIYPRKGHGLLLEAVALVRARGFECYLKIFGSTLAGEERQLTMLLEKSRELEISDAVEFAGFVDDPALMYPCLDVLVLASVEPEALPLACLEAQAWGLPVIAPNEAGPTEIVVHNETGLLVPPRDVTALASAIELLAAAPDARQRLGRAGRQRVSTEFNPRTFQLKVSALVERALARSQVIPAMSSEK
jgi:glycosyltransferase involved in cell wall biosynthesis